MNHYINTGSARGAMSSSVSLDERQALHTRTHINRGGSVWLSKYELVLIFFCLLSVWATPLSSQDGNDPCGCLGYTPVGTAGSTTNLGSMTIPDCAQVQQRQNLR